jgi:hypothetical protein
VLATGAQMLSLFLFSFLFYSVLGFELGAYTLSHSTSPFLMDFFKIGSDKLCPGWLCTVILLISEDYKYELQVPGPPFLSKEITQMISFNLHNSPIN